MESIPDHVLLPRAARAAVERACKVAPVVVVLGARQTGKTTLVRSLPALSALPYLTLDDFDLRAQAESDPESVVDRAPRMIIDEVQRAKDLLIAVKRAVDRDRRRRPGRFILTGSANLLMLEQLAETLAGRAVYVTLWPFTLAERRGAGATGAWGQLLETPFARWRDVLRDRNAEAEEWRGAARRGGLPVPVRHLATDDERSLWFAGYTQTFIERDLPTLRAVENLADFRRLMRASCLRIGSLVNQAELGRDVGLSQPQVHRFLNVLEASYQLVRLEPFSVNRTSRLIKTPKLYWSDTGLAMHLAGEDEPRGCHLENLVLCELLAWRELQIRRPEVLYWRTAAGLEVDFVIESGRKVVPVEVKASARVATSDAKGLEAFLDEYPDVAKGGLLLHTGTETFPLSRRVLAAPWWSVCG